MSSKDRRKIARQNGAKAAGTKTPEGIAISSQNARRHGLTSKILVLANESEDEYLALEREYVTRFQPADGVEMDLVDDLVSARWRLRRIRDMQTAAIDLKMAIQLADVTEQFLEIDESTRAIVAFSALANQEKSLQLLLRYETTYNHMYNRALKTLQDLQKNRPSHPESETSEILRNDPENTPPDAPHPAQKNDSTHEPLQFEPMETLFSPSRQLDAPAPDLIR